MRKIHNPSPDLIMLAAKTLIQGNLVAFPTETVYGLGANASNHNAVKRIYAVKSRPPSHPLIIHISSIEKIGGWATKIPDYALKLSENFWPGPMTLILKRSSLAKNFITGNQEIVGIRVPAHPIATLLLAKFEQIGGFGVVAPSANKFGAVSPTTAEHVYDELGPNLAKEDVILNGGQCQIGIESTIIDCTGIKPNILRPGYITNTQINKLINSNIQNSGGVNSIKVPGNFKSHYKPKTKIVISGKVQPGDGFFALKSSATPKGVFRLAEPSNINEFGKLLYGAFRLADKMLVNRIFIEIPEGAEFLDAINDRIKKAMH